VGRVLTSIDAEQDLLQDEVNFCLIIMVRHVSHEMGFDVSLTVRRHLGYHYVTEVFLGYSNFFAI
jgi:hypothetical protein